VSLLEILVGVIIAFTFIIMILFVLFGQITVRKLRKNPETRHELGLEFASGWDILNVAQALSLPKKMIQKMKKSPLYAVLEADAEVLYQHTTVFDRCLARVFYWLSVIFTLLALIFLFLNAMGVFD